MPGTSPGMTDEERRDGVAGLSTRRPARVMAGLVPAIHDLNTAPAGMGRRP